MLSPSAIAGRYFLVLLLFCAFFVGRLPTVFGQTRMDDSLSLVDLYNSTNGPGWTNTWDLSMPMDTWYGVTLNTGRVNCLDLNGVTGCNFNNAGGNNLTGPLPNLNLTEVTELWLDFNNLSGPLPNLNLPNLTRLDLSANQFSGTIPNFNLPNLNDLWLQNNQLTGTIPDFTNLPSLSNFWLDNNQLVGGIPDFNFANNCNVYLRDNDLSDLVPGFTGNYSIFVITGNQFTFEDLIDSYTINNNIVGNYVYTIQQDISTQETINVPVNSNYTIDLLVDDTVTTSTYLWFKDGLPFTTTNVNVLNFPNFQTTDEGVYYCEITNPNVPGLILISREKTLVACPFEISISTINTSCSLDNGSLTATPSGGDGNYTYQWSTGASSPTISNLPSSSYSLTVTDGTGCVATISTIIPFAGQPTIEWEKSLGGSNGDEAYAIQQTVDGGFIVAGSTNSDDGDVVGFNGSYDAWVVKLNTIGNIEWQKSLGGSSVDGANSVQQTQDGGFIVAGSAHSNDGDVSNNNGNVDAWVVKLNTIGNIEWQKALGGSGVEYANSVQPTQDGGYIVAGYTNSNDGNVSGNHGSNDFWVVKLDNIGNILWQNALGGSFNDRALSIQETLDAGYIVAGYSNSIDGDVTGNHGFNDYWIVKLNNLGNLQWQKSLGGSAADVANSIQQTLDGGYIVSGYSASNDGDLTTNQGGLDYWVIKLDNIGDIEWQKSLGGSLPDNSKSVQQTPDGGYLVIGNSSSNDGDVSGNNGDQDHWLVKLDNAGNLVWQKSLGGSLGDYGSSIEQTQDGGIIVAGGASSIDGDVTGNIGGTDFWIVKLTQSLPLTITLTPTDPPCNNTSTGSIETTVMGGVPPYSYNWSNGTTSSVVNGLPSGTYSITITDANGCSVTNSTNLIEPPELFTGMPGFAEICFGASDGEIDLTPTGGTPPYTYQWSNGTTTEDLTGLATGTYEVTLTDANGCKVTNSLMFDEVADLTPTITILSDAGCTGSEGSATAIVNGAIYSYFSIEFYWSNGYTSDSYNGGTSTVTGLAPGNYSLTVSQFDYTGTGDVCQAVGTFNILGSSTVTLSAIVDQQIQCFGQNDGAATATASGGLAPYNYQWGNGETTGSATGLSIGTNAVTVTDQNGCTETTSVFLTSPFVINTTATVVSDVSCNGFSDGSASVVAAGGAGGYTYLWDNGETTITATGLSSGIHVVTVTDANACTVTDNVTISSVSNFAATALEDNPVLCLGESTGAATINATGGTPSYTYLWDNGETTTTAISLSAGSHNFTVTDANACTVANNIIISNASNFAATAIEDSPVLCFGESTGAATVNVTGGTPGYTFLWDNGGTTATVSNLTGGAHAATITDANGCFTTTTVNINTVLELSCTVIASQQISCSGASDGAVISTTTGGSIPYNYQWSNGQTVMNLTSISGGTYTLTVTDVNGCRATASTTLAEPNALSTSATENSPLSCAGASDGSATVSASGGTPPGYSYIWDNGETIATPTNLSAGNHFVTVSDANFCSATASVFITQPFPMQAMILSNTPASCLACIGTANLQITEGTSPYTYLWTNGNTQEDPMDLCSILNTVTVTDANGCQVIASVNIGNSTDFAISTLTINNNVICNGESNGSASIFGSGGMVPYTYMWSNGATGSFTASFPAGNHGVTVTDANGCIDSRPVTITELPELSITNITETDPACQAQNGEILVVATGGTGTYNYSIDLGMTFVPQNNLTGLGAGNYEVVVQDANGCTVTSNMITLTDQLPPTIDNVTTVDPLCQGANGSITIIASGGTPPLNYSLDNLTYQSASSFNGLGQGGYTVYVQDVNGCLATDMVSLTELSGPSITNVTTADATCGIPNGTITIQANGLSTPLDYSIDNGNTIQSNNLFTNLAPGNYVAFVSDANGCSQTMNTFVNDAFGPNIVATNTNDPSCGQSNGSVTIGSTPGTGSTAFSIDNGATFLNNNIFNGLPAGSYNVVVQDANNCTDTASVTLVDLPPPTIDSVQQIEPICNLSNGGIIVFTSSGILPIQYSIDGGATFQTSSSFAGLAPNNYSIVVEDATGCIASSTITLTNQPPPVFTLLQGVTATYCGKSIGQLVISAQGQAAPLEYSLNSGIPQSSNIFPNLAAGVYDVDVTDTNGCSVTRSFTILDLPGPMLTSNVLASPACGMAIGSVELSTSGGVFPYQYSMNSGAFTPSNVFTNLPAGTHQVIVSDFNDCRDTLSITLTDLPELMINSSNITSPTCGLQNGSIAIVPSGGTPPLQYSNDGGMTYQGSNIFTGLATGTYDLVVLDLNMCTASLQAILADPGGPVIDNVIFTTPACGNANGGLVIEVVGGTAPFLYSIDGGTTFHADSVFTNLLEGAYAISVVDDFGCTSDTTVFLMQVNGPSLTLTSVDPSCDLDNGSVTANPSGGTAPYLYSLDGVNFQNSNMFIGLSAATYSIVIEDANSCQSTATASLTNIPGLSLSIASEPETCEIGTGSISVSVFNGTSPFSYSWNTAPTQTNAQATGLQAGAYAVTVIDADGCSETAAGIVTADSLAIDLGGDVVICGQPNVLLGSQLQLSNMSYQWSNGSDSATIVANTFSIYSLTVTDANNCSAIDSIEVVDAEFDPQVMPSDTSALEDEFVELLAVGGDNYEWLFPTSGLSCTLCPDPAFTAVDSVTYSVEVSLDIGCVDTVSVTINVLDSYFPLVEVPDVFSPNGDGMNDNWIIPFIEFFPENQLTVINRWGDVVYQANPYTNEWDGTFNGQFLPQGTYYFILELNVNQFETFKGPLTILK